MKTMIVRYIFFCCLISILFSSCGVRLKQQDRLKNELQLILNSDQELRELFTSDITKERKAEILEKYKISEKDFKEKYWKITEENDSLNVKKIKKIIKKFGYPGKSLVGNKLSTTAWYVIQHANLQVIEKYFPMIESANKKNELDFFYVAEMKDRLLMLQEKEQIYGTQGAGRLFINKETGIEEWTNFIWPIKDWNKVNELRKSIGINQTIEEYAKDLGVNPSKKYTIEEIKNLTKK